MKANNRRRLVPQQEGKTKSSLPEITAARCVPLVRSCARWSLLVISLLALLPTMLASGPGAAQAASSHNSLTVVGRWNLIVTFKETGQKVPSEVIFVKGGTFLNLTPGPGTGSWRTAENADDERRGFSYEFTELIYTNGQLTNFVKVTQQAELARDGMSYTAHGVGVVYTLDGNEVARNQTTTVATRAS